MEINKFVCYRGIFEQDEINQLFVSIENKDEINFVSQLLNLTEKYRLTGNLYQSLITYLLAYHENVFSLALERKKEISEDLENTIKYDMNKIYSLFHIDLSFINDPFSKTVFHYQSTFQSYNKEGEEILSNLQNSLKKCMNTDEFYEVLYNHYYHYGVGLFGLNKAFRYHEGIEAIQHIGDNTLNDLVGCDQQTKRLCQNTEAFLNNLPANNVLLYGDSGTGKSSSIKALLNEYYKDGLRMIEIYKHQFIHLPKIIHEIQNRNYKFIIFMDDLSFEEFEIEYKYLKAVIEGGLEKKPDNILIYATSNRRHLIKETWSERQYDEEVNINDAKQEKLSLVSRFGVQIMYIHPKQKEYLDIVDSYALRNNISIDQNILHQKALQWQMRNGGLSGRTAMQFIQSLSGNMNENT